MKIYLAQNQPTAFIYQQGISKFYPNLNLLPCRNCDDENQFCEKLLNQFKEERECNISDYQLTIEIVTNPLDELKSGMIQVLDNHGIFKTLSDLLNDKDLRVVVGLSCRGPQTLDNTLDFSINTTVMRLRDDPLTVLKDYKVRIPDLFNHIGALSKWFLTIILTFNETDLEKKLTCEKVAQKMSICQRILHEEIASDVSIITKEGTSVKCHKSFLLAHSSVFSAMFQSGMREDQTSIVEMPDISEDGVRALLEYLYCWDLTRSKESSLIAFELLNAAHKYDIPKLETTMKEMMLSKSHDYYDDVDVAVKLFLFARNLPSGDDLKMKAIKVMKENLSTLEQCPSYKELFKENPQVAMELCKYAFSA